MPAQTSFEPTFEPIHLVLQGYLPPTRNELDGRHWSIQKRERARAAKALLDALRSESLATQSGPQTGTDGASSRYKTAFDTLVCYLQATAGTLSVGMSPRKRFHHKRKKGP
jgi:hypothetical protein